MIIEDDGEFGRQAFRVRDVVWLGREAGYYVVFVRDHQKGFAVTEAVWNRVRDAMREGK